MSRWCFKTYYLVTRAEYQAKIHLLSFLIVVSQRVAHIVSFTSLVKTNHACFPCHHSGGVRGWRQDFSSLSLESFYSKNTPSSPSRLPCHLRLKAHRLWQYGRGLPQQLKGLESYCVALLHLVRENLLWVCANNLTWILFGLELKTTPIAILVKTYIIKTNQNSSPGGLYWNFRIEKACNFGFKD